ncbi:thiamine pyrophosphate-binding protein [Litorivicinus sp.]|jgi:acetolactate synthase-1/2/3 large subunit|nr:thiamine pyrophosphate-binding protein [Litorivicinus sp.]|tara:strand:+ start:3612 stop:5360 length:1749 start_codon:yes stop_codon:yes gene_type:complete
MNRNTYEKYQSDVIVDLLKQYDIKHISMNPGASFRGLHDSIVNYGENNPELMVCQHEEIAVQIAHGYARATGKPMGVILHNLVGMLHAQMAVYYAYIDRAPIFIMGATGPMHEGKRRPHIDWSHSALVQGEAMRNYTKWDYQPHAIEGVPESFMRAYSAMVTEPAGPIYMCYDAWLQEEKLTADLDMPPPDMQKAPSPMGADPDKLAEMVDVILNAKHPIILVDYIGRQEGNFEKLVELAEALGCGVWDINNSLAFPNQHPLCISLDHDSLKDADVILGIDVRDWEKPTHKLISTTREVTSHVPDDCVWMELGFAELEISAWAFDYGRYQPKKHIAMGDPRISMPEMTKIANARLKEDSSLVKNRDKRSEKFAARHHELFAGWKKQAEAKLGSDPISYAELVTITGEVIRDEDWVLAVGTAREWARKLWNFDKPYRHPGRSLGTSTQIGMSLGVALAYRGTDKLVLNFQPDGDLMYDAGALWTAAKHEIPILIVMCNNRAYYNDWEHQERMAHLRGTDVEKAHIGMDIFGPEPDFATLAQSMGMHGEGPIEDPSEIAAALKRAIAVVKSGKPALVDIVVAHR